jgi:hypothetical protein
MVKTSGPHMWNTLHLHVMQIVDLNIKSNPPSKKVLRAPVINHGSWQGAREERIRRQATEILECSLCLIDLTHGTTPSPDRPCHRSLTHEWPIFPTGRIHLRLAYKAGSWCVTLQWGPIWLSDGVCIYAAHFPGWVILVMNTHYYFQGLKYRIRRKAIDGLMVSVLKILLP